MLKVKTAVDIRDEWTAELRSGRWKKVCGGTGASHPRVHACALQILALQIGLTADEWSSPEVRRAAGLSYGDYSNIYDLNDKKNSTFSEIADYIDTLPYTS